MACCRKSRAFGNKLERGTLKIDEHCFVDLKGIRNPIVIFASSGDNISPPHQALNWIPAIYPTTADLKKARQRIVYLLNPHVGHLGIFVSGSVARLEHRAILESLGDLAALKPGLYEMKISNPTGDPDCRKPQYTVRFEERTVEQIRYAHPQRSFEKVEAVSEWNEVVYQNTLRPWVTACSSPLSAEALKWLHPMRFSTLMFSEKFNPWMLPLKLFAPFLAQQRMPANQDNPYSVMEGHTSKLISQSLNSYRIARDGASERLFSFLYGKD